MARNSCAVGSTSIVPLVRRNEPKLLPNLGHARPELGRCGSNMGWLSPTSGRLGDDTCTQFSTACATGWHWTKMLRIAMLCAHCRGRRGGVPVALSRPAGGRQARELPGRGCGDPPQRARGHRGRGGHAARRGLRLAATATGRRTAPERRPERFPPGPGGAPSASSAPSEPPVGQPETARRPARLWAPAHPHRGGKGSRSQGPAGSFRAHAAAARAVAARNGAPPRGGAREALGSPEHCRCRFFRALRGREARAHTQLYPPSRHRPSQRLRRRRRPRSVGPCSGIACGLGQEGGVGAEVGFNQNSANFDRIEGR